MNDQEMNAQADEVVLPEPTPVVEEIANIDDLLAVEDLDVRYIPLPAPYKGGVKVRPLTMLEIRNARKAATKRVRDADGIKQELDEAALAKSYMLMCVVEPSISAVQYDSMLQKNWALLEAIMVGVNEVNGFVTKITPQGEDAEIEAEF